jgi:hypothetical protein
MSPALLAAVLSAAVAAPAPAEEIKPPAGPPPTQVVASMDKDGNIIEVIQTVIEYRTEVRTVTKVIMGKNVAENYTVTVPVTKQTRQQFAAKDAKVYTAGGKEVGAKDVPDKLKKPTIALLSANGQKVDPFYLKIIKEDTLVIVAQAAAPAAPPQDKPAAGATEEAKRAAEEAARAAAERAEAVKRAAAAEAARAEAAKRAAEKRPK